MVHCVCIMYNVYIRYMRIVQVQHYNILPTSKLKRYIIHKSTTNFKAYDQYTFCTNNLQFSIRTITQHTSGLGKTIFVLKALTIQKLVNILLRVSLYKGSLNVDRNSVGNKKTTVLI